MRCTSRTSSSPSAALTCCDVLPGRADYPHARQAGIFTFGMNEACGPMSSDDGLSGSGMALHDEGTVSGPGDEAVLVRLQSRQDRTEMSRAGALEGFPDRSICPKRGRCSGTVDWGGGPFWPEAGEGGWQPRVRGGWWFRLWQWTRGATRRLRNRQARAGTPSKWSIGSSPVYVVDEVNKVIDPGDEGSPGEHISGKRVNVQWAFARIGVAVPGTTSQQILVGTPAGIEDLRPGDLIFTRGGRTVRDLGHVAIYAGGGMEIVSPRTGDVVSLRPVRRGNVQAIRRVLRS